MTDLENIELSAANRVLLARGAERPNIEEYISALFTEFMPLAGDRRFAEDESILGGIALYNGIPVTVIGHRKGRVLEENVRFNFGMPGPEGYRKAERLMRGADKFGRPIITFIDTPGAYPGLEAEQRGQGEAIASCLATMSSLSVPVIAIVTGEGGSGGALAIAVANKLLMLENAVFSILSPEGFATILWKDSTRWQEAAEVMRLTAADIVSLGIADGIIKEPLGGAQKDHTETFKAVDKAIARELKALCAQSPSALQKSRYQKIRAIGGGELSI